jgi:hypothetical protein
MRNISVIHTQANDANKSEVNARITSHRQGDNYTFNGKQNRMENGNLVRMNFVRHHPPTSSLGPKCDLTKSGKWQQRVCHKLSHPLLNFCRHLPAYDTGNCRNMTQFATVRGI